MVRNQWAQTQVHSSSCGSTRLHTWWQEMYISHTSDRARHRESHQVKRLLLCLTETSLSETMSNISSSKIDRLRGVSRILSDSSTGARRVSKHRHLYFQCPRIDSLHTGTTFLDRTMENYGGCKIQSFAKPSTWGIAVVVPLENLQKKTLPWKPSSRLPVR